MVIRVDIKAMGDKTVMLKNSDVTLEPLGKDIKIFTDNIHKFTTDTILLASFASQKKVNSALELCCGSGAISLILCRDKICKQICSVDIQEKACRLLEKSVQYNNLGSIMYVYNEDLNNLYDVFKGRKFDMIVANPPYQIIGKANKNKNVEKLTARHENCCTIEDIIRLSSKLLNFSGSLYICCRIHRLSEIIACMKRYNIEPKLLQLVQYSKNKPPKLFLVQGCLGGKEYINVLPTLIINNSLGQYTDEMKKIYGAYLNRGEVAN